MKFNFLIVILLYTSLSFSQENCNNGIDDDGDGKIDLNDSECVCSTTPIPSIIPNPSFEVFSSCPTTFSYSGNDQLSLATPWIQATDATSDYFNKCGYVADAISSVPELINFPDGNGIVGTLYERDWNEYVGTTLLSSMVAGTNYQLTFNIAAISPNSTLGFSGADVSIYEPVNVTLYGCSTGTNLPISTTFSPNQLDPTWFEVGNITYTPASVWGEITILFTPTVNINAIMIGPPPVLPLSYPERGTADTLPYFLYDNLRLNTASSFGVNITQTGIFCDANMVLTSHITTTVSPGTTYQWYQNGIAIIGATNSTYNVPAGASNLGNYSVKITDGTNCYISSPITVSNTVPGPNTSTTQPNCSISTGSITITTPASEYSFDNGLTWQVSPTKNLLSIGTYYVKIKTATGCISSSIGVEIIGTSLPPPDFTSIDPATCSVGGSITIITSATEYSFDGGITWTTNPIATNLIPGTYSIKIKNNLGCISEENIVYIYSFAGIPSPYYSIIQPDCSVFSGTITITSIGAEYSFDNGLTWQTSNVKSGLASGDYYIRIKDSTGCISDVNLATINPTTGAPIVPVFTIIQPFCDTSTGTITITSIGAEYSFDDGVTWQNSNVKSNLAPGSYAIKVKDVNGCISTNSAAIIINYVFPNPPVIELNQKFCIQYHSTLSDINVTGQNIQWYDSATGGNLLPLSTLLVFGTTYYASQTLNDGCESLRIGITVIASNAATISEITIADWTDSNNTITILLSDLSLGDYEYSINGITYQDSNIFSNLDPGIYTISVRDKNGCGTVKEDVYLLIYPRFFTPNGDGHNDTWSVKFSHYEPGLKVKILDRYGKFIKELNYNESWDGTYNGLELPSTDYWFVVNRADGKEFKGHFSMKR